MMINKHYTENRERKIGIGGGLQFLEEFVLIGLSVL